MDPVKAARNRKDGALLQLFDEHHLALFRFAYRLTGSVTDAEDIVQECFLALLRPGCSYDPRRTPVRTYLFGVVRNQFLKRRRKNNLVNTDGPELWHDRSPESEALHTERADAVAHAVMRLPEAQRAVLILAHYEQVPMAEIARVMALDVGAVKSRLQRARKLETNACRVRAGPGAKTMNDTELDELLNTWSTPPAPASMRECVRSGFAAHAKQSPDPLRRITAFLPKVKKSLVAGAILAAAAFFLAVTLALPQTRKPVSLPAGIPYIVDSDVVWYADDGTFSVEEHRGSYNNNGCEIGVYAVYPSFLDALQHALGMVGAFMGRLTLPLVVSPELLKKFASAARVSAGAEHGFALGSGAALINAGCVYGAVVGRETILGHPTVAVQPNLSEHERVTFWMAPDLGCFALRITVEEKQPDGTFRLVIRKQALKVTWNAANHGTRNSTGGL